MYIYMYTTCMCVRVCVYLHMCLHVRNSEQKDFVQKYEFSNQNVLLIWVCIYNLWLLVAVVKLEEFLRLLHFLRTISPSGVHTM